ncbi:hypothetical protein AMECASPLE_021646 [Ameca splendens]|uniref:Secreted protein n=1 Tax=Ameca splendens TaxID=208324 RepID=A0ABV0YEN7_9TELE
MQWLCSPSVIISRLCVTIVVSIWEDFLFKIQLTCQKASPLLIGPKLTGGVPTGNTRRSHRKHSAFPPETLGAPTGNTRRSHRKHSALPPETLGAPPPCRNSRNSGVAISLK